ncbi:MAG TPA: hypothetical protein VGN72_18605 [Tepidisphaeraceae bacterium]|nr:hypothetical protein [Tepidisphaeraceae bacterium]
MRIRPIHCLLPLALLTGCFGRRDSGDAPQQPLAPSTAPRETLPVSAGSATPLDPPVDARTDLLVRTRLDMLILTLPYGTVSQSESFWKQVEETALPPETYDVLFKNGVRVGLAPTSEWAFFRDLIAQYPAISQRGEYAGGESKPVEVMIRRDIDSQTIFYLDAANRLQGRSYDRSEDLLSITFQQSPRTPGALRVAVVPVVRSQRVRIEYNAENVGNEVQYVNPEHLYDLSLATEIPRDQFLIIAPSREGRWPTSLGNVFLTANGTAERQERVVLLVPRVVTLREAGQ